MPLLQRIDLDNKQTQVLVLTPTRELAIQVATAFERYGSGLNGLRVASIYGGQDYQVQFRQLDRGVHVIVGTPGRVMDHMRRGSLKLEALQGLVLDEADEMLRMGFAEDVEWVLSQSPASRQMALFSATMPSAIRRIAKKHMTNPAEVTIQQQSATADTVRQRFVIAAPHQKQGALGRILEAEPIDAVLVFVKTKITSEPLAEFLSARGHRTAVLHGDVAQKQRERIVEKLRAGKIDVLVATDVAARGLDVQRISHVINYDLPFDSEAYVHRIGRTGRAGRSGEAILFVHPRGTARSNGLNKTCDRRSSRWTFPRTVPSISSEWPALRADSHGDRASTTGKVRVDRAAVSERDRRVVRADRGRAGRAGPWRLAAVVDRRTSASRVRRCTPDQGAVPFTIRSTISHPEWSASGWPSAQGRRGISDRGGARPSGQARQHRGRDHR